VSKNDLPNFKLQDPRSFMPPPPPGEAPIGIANPASEYCVKMGGSVSIEDTKDGQVGYCQFSHTSKKCEEWAFYRGECKI
jgi:putative hemolysin